MGENFFLFNYLIILINIIQFVFNGLLNFIMNHPYIIYFIFYIFIFNHLHYLYLKKKLNNKINQLKT